MGLETIENMLVYVGKTHLGGGREISVILGQFWQNNGKSQGCILVISPTYGRIVSKGFGGIGGGGGGGSEISKNNRTKSNF